MDHLQSILASEAFNSSVHPFHGRLMDAIASWRDSTWQDVPEAQRADFLPLLARSGAYTDPAHPKRAELQQHLAQLDGSLEWMRVKGALQPAVDPETASVRDLLTSYPARDEKHPLHAAVRARIDGHYETQVGNEPIN